MKNKINALQFGVFLGLASLGFVTMFGESVSCFTMIITTIFGFALLIPMFCVSSYKSIEVSFIVRIISFIFVILMMVYIVDKYSEFFIHAVNPSTPYWFVSGLVIVCALYPSIKGIEAVSRTALISMFFVILSVTLIFIVLPWGDMSGYRDIETSFISKDSIDVLLCLSPFILSIFFYRNISKSRVRSVVLPYIVTVIVFTAVICFVKYLSLTEYEYIYYALSEVSCSNLPKGLSGLFIAFSLVCVYFSVLYLTHSAKAIIKNNNKWIVVFISVVVYLLSVFTLYFDSFRNIILNRYLLFVLFLLVALVVPISASIKEKNNE